ncbi:MAG: heme a synthase [Thermoplasmata archaeon]|jgi:heme A synthase|nr:heme a synthase [Thermoplasmata archaeon]MEA3166360.1 heme a synthase [Thermoplasmata archaeon]
MPAQRLLWLRRLSLLCVGMTILLMALGAWVKANGAGLACPDWPQCYGEWFPPFPSQENGRLYAGEPVAFTQAQVLYEWGHRAVVSLLLVPLVAFAIVALRTPDAHPIVRRLPLAAVGLYFGQAALGAVTVITGNPAWATTAHLVLATVLLTTLVVAASAVHFRPLGDPKPAPPEPPKPRVVSYVYQDGAVQAPAPGSEGPDG